MDGSAHHQNPLTFRERIENANVSSDLLADADRQIGATGYIARGGQVIDGTLIRVRDREFALVEIAL